MKTFIRTLMLLCTLPAFACDGEEFDLNTESPGDMEDDARIEDDEDVEVDAADEDDEPTVDGENEPHGERKAPAADPRPPGFNPQPDPPGFNPQPDSPAA